MTDLTTLDAWLADTVNDWRPVAGLAYRGPADFVAAHGTAYDVAAVMPGAPRLCYMNAIGYAAAFGWTYVEGFAMVPVTPGTQRRMAPGVIMRMAPGDEVVQHAWCIDRAGRPVEVTWPVPGRAYRGVPLDVWRADDATWNGDATTLDDFNRGWPLLRESWPGADPPGEPADPLATVRVGVAVDLARQNSRMVRLVAGGGPIG